MFVPCVSDYYSFAVSQSRPIILSLSHTEGARTERRGWCVERGGDFFEELDGVGAILLAIAVLSIP